MRDDLHDAYAMVEWAVTHIPIMQQRLRDWINSEPYRLVIESDPLDRGWDLLVAYPDKPLDPLISVDLGAILNSIRSALDLLAAAISNRNGVLTNGRTQFFIREREADAEGAWDGAKREQWLSETDLSKIKGLRPYSGGDSMLWPLHRLDIIRKHHRFVSAEPEIDTAMVTHAYWRPAPLWQNSLNDKTVLCRTATGVTFTPSKGNTKISARVIINEAALNLHGEPAIELVRAYARRVADIIAMFDE